METEAEPTCGRCRKTGEFSPPVSVVLLFAPGLSAPYPLIPGEEYCVCEACDAIERFVSGAAEAHPVTRSAGPWTRAIVIFQDGHGAEVRAKATPQMALA
ncbi:MAG TPA: hypothetical protein VLW85_06905 [Myxococcales bacterium]|nr:hypothetical protein [Myxococcales bacterium]